MKLSPWTVIIVAISLAVSILAFTLFHKTLPTLTEAGYYNEYREKLETEANKMSQAEKRVKDAMRLVQEKADVWNAYVAERTPPNTVEGGGINLAVNAYQLSVDVQKFRNNVQRAVNNQVKRGGVKVVNGPYVTGPADVSDSNGILASYFHYPAIPFPIVIFDLGTVTVQGTYKQIMDNVRSYKSMPHYLAVADGLRIDGTSPLMTGTYQLQVVGFIRGNKIYPAVPSGGGGAAAAGGGFGNPFGAGPPASLAGRGGLSGFGPPAGAGAPASAGAAKGGKRGDDSE